MNIFRHLNFKILVPIIFAIVLLAVYFFFFYDPIQDIRSEFENIGLKVEPLVFEGRRIHFPYTDENEGESIIIKSDKKVYVGGDRSDVYFSITNTGDKSEKVAILKYFPKEYGDISYVDVWSGDGWQGLPLVRGDIKGNMTKLGKAFEKKKPVPDRFDVKAGIQFEISSGRTVYFKAVINYPFDKEGEFWFEAFGDQGGYGLLDPLFVGGTTTSRDTPSGWYNTGGTWDYRRKITVDKSKVSGTSNLTNFPVLVSMTATDLRHTSFGGKVASSSAGVTGGGGDFVFTSSDGTTKIDHEIEKYSSSSGEIIAWVEIPTLSVTVDTPIYVYYGGPSSGATNQNKTGTWNSDYIGVYHMNTDPSKTCASTYELCDSTANANHMDMNGTMTASDLVDGALGKAIDFDNSDDYFASGTMTGGSASTNTITMQAWVNTAGITAYDGALVTRTATFRGLIVGGGTSNPMTGVWNDNANEYNASTGQILTNSRWYYYSDALTASGHNLFFGDRGVISKFNITITNTARSMAVVWDIGRDSNAAARYWNGRLDEVRLVNVTLSDDWLKTEYTNQFKPSGFYTVGGLENRTAQTVKIGQTTTSRDTPSGWYNTGGTWDYRRKVTVDKSKISGTSNLSNFPVLVSMIATDLRHTSFGGKVASSSAGVTGGGGDFVFTSSDGTTKLDHEIEKYSSSSGELIAWVEIPTLSVTVDTPVYVYYGGPSSGATNQNKTGVWNSDYKGVWHFNNKDIDGGSGDIKDSTSNANNASTSGMTTADQVPGKVDGSFDLDGSADYVNAGSPDSLDQIGDRTYSFWMYPQKVSSRMYLIDKSPTSGSTGSTAVRAENLLGTEALFFIADTSGTDVGRRSVNNVVASNSWQYVAVTWDGTVDSTKVHIYKNGVELNYAVTNSSTGNLSSDALNDFKMGVDGPTTGNFFNGLMDEVRVSTIERSADWIKTEYTNQFKPSGFYTVGGVESRTAQTVKIGQTTTSRDTPPGWYNTGGTWSYRKRITIDKNKVSGTSDLSNFPVLIARTDTNFKHTSFGGNVASSSAGATGGGGDFVFTSSDGTTKIDHEIEKYSSSSGEIIAWVEVPTLSVSADTVLYVYYGGPSSGATNQNKTGTWDANYEGVWHLKETDTDGGSGDIKDSTSNANNGTTAGMSAGEGQVSGYIDGAINFDGTDARIDTADLNDLDGVAAVTYSAWVRSDTRTDYDGVIGKSGNDNCRVSMAFGGASVGDNDDGSVMVGSSGNTYGYSTGNILADSIWNYWTMVYNGGGSTNADKLKFYFNGVEQSLTFGGTIPTTTCGTNTAGVSLGWEQGTRYLDGRLDEARISTTNRSDGWVKTEYNNQRKPATFYGFGGQQKLNP